VKGSGFRLLSRRIQNLPRATYVKPCLNMCLSFRSFFLLEWGETLYEPPHQRAVARHNIFTFLSTRLVHLPSSFHVIYFSLVLLQKQIECADQILAACRKQGHHTYLYYNSMNSEVGKGVYLICSGMWLIGAIIRTFWDGNLLFASLSHYMQTRIRY
jgi:hypothetical protein